MSTTETVTEEQVKEWMAGRFAECRGIMPEGPVQFLAKYDNFSGAALRIRFQAYSEEIGHGSEAESSDDAIESFRQIAVDYSPLEKAAQLREQAARLIDEASELEAATL